MSDTQNHSTRVPIRVRCEGSGCPPAGRKAADPLQVITGPCAMCGQVRMVTLGRVELHDRVDVLAMLDRGDYGSAETRTAESEGEAGRATAGISERDDWFPPPALPDRRVEAVARVLMTQEQTDFYAWAAVALAAADAVDAPALAEARQLLAVVCECLYAVLVYRERVESLPPGTLTDNSGCGRAVERARRFLADQETTCSS